MLDGEGGLGYWEVAPWSICPGIVCVWRFVPSYLPATQWKSASIFGVVCIGGGGVLERYFTYPVGIASTHSHSYLRRCSCEAVDRGFEEVMLGPLSECCSKESYWWRCSF